MSTGPSSPHLKAALLILAVLALGIFPCVFDTAAAAVALPLGALAALLAFDILKRPQVLRHEVELRTCELSETNRRLAAEIVERQYAEDALRESESQLERRVEERTAELCAANAALHEEHRRQRELIGKLEAAQHRLLESERMAAIGQLAAGVAHEINNPVGFVNSNLSTLRQYADDLLALLALYEESVTPLLAAYPDVLADIAEARERADLAYLREDLLQLLAETQAGVDRVAKIVQALRDFSHVGEPGWQAVDLQREIDSTLDVVWSEVGSKAEVRREYGAIPPIECIPSQLNQVFMNLFLNAAHAIDNRGVITVRTTMAGDMVCVEVADTGKGIVPEHRPRLFEPFFTTRPVGQGCGLGLTFSYGVVRKHGGSIEVESEPGKGSLFRVRLPVRRPPGNAGLGTEGNGSRMHDSGLEIPADPHILH